MLFRAKQNLDVAEKRQILNIVLAVNNLEIVMALTILRFSDQREILDDLTNQSFVKDELDCA